jgi:hypothetical protein
MPSTYTLNNGIELIGTGEQSGTWGDTTNTNLGLLDVALDGQVTVALASAGSSGSPNSLPISDGTASNGRNRMVVFSDSGDLGATAYVQLTPNDAEKIIYIRNSLSGSRSVILFQGTYNASNDYEVPAGTTAVVYFDGAGAGAVAANVFNNAYFDGLRLGSVSVTAILDEDNMASDSAAALATQQSIKAYVDAQVATVDTLAEILAIGNTTGATDIAVDSAQKVQFRDAAIYINSSVDGQLDIVADTEIQIAATTIDVNGALDVSGTALVTGVLTTTAATVSNGGGQFNGAINVGVDDTGYDVKFFGATTGKSLLWDESADSLIVTGTTTLVGTTNLDAVDIDGATQIDATVTVGVDDTGYDVKFFGATAGAYMLWDESADDLILGGAAGLSVNSAATVGGTLGVTGVVTANAGVVVDNFTLDGTTLALSSGNFTLDVSGDINLDSDSGYVLFKDAGIEHARIFQNNSGDVNISSQISDKDMKFLGNDGGSTITALTLDMSSAGAATFNTSVLLSGTGGLTTTGGNNLTVSGSVLNHAGLIFATQAILPAQEGAEAAANVIDLGANANEFKSLYLNTSIINDSGFTIDSGGDITFDAAGADIFFGAIGNVGSINMAANNLTLSSLVSDADMLFKGNDGGSTITALTLDMSEAGAATFNNKVLAPILNAGSFSSVSIGVPTADANVAELGAGYLNLGRDDTADAKQLLFSKNGGTHSFIETKAASLEIVSSVSDSDIIFKGSDGGSVITALTLDMSDAGSATFNKDIFLPDAGRLYFTSTSGFSPRISNATTTTTMSFFTNNTERMSIDSGGDVTVKTGNLVIGTAGKGIDFSVVTGGAGTATGNVLSDYEEGTFYPC